MNMNFDRARFNMVEQQIRPWEVLDSRVLALLETIHREDFVPVRYRKLAFADMSIPLGFDQVMMSPIVEGRLLQALNLQEDDTVLEIGTGSGFVTACLATLAKRVVTVETAFANGADYIVVGRPIRDAASPREAAESIQASIEAQFA